MKKYGMLHSNKLKFLVTLSSIFLGFALSGCFGGLSGNNKLVVINVLDKVYYDDCHIKGSVNIPFEELEDSLKKHNKDYRYVLYCSNYACTAAPFLANMMVKAGFKDVSLLPGGIAEWYQKGYPVSGPAKKTYLTEPNEKLDDDESGVKILTADQLLEKMKDFNLL